MADADSEIFGALAPGKIDRLVMALTSPLPDNWLGLRLAILLRRAVTMRLDYPDGALDVVRWGMRLRLHPRDNGCEKNILFTPRMYEPIELGELAADIARAADQGRPFVFVDVGANVGLFSFFVASRAGQSARIFAIEPEPGNLRRMNFNIGLNTGVPIKVIPQALSDTAGYVTVHLNRRDRGGTRITTIDQSQTPSGVVVPTQTLLNLLITETVDAVDALKIDVEGLEDVILEPFFRDAPMRLWPRLVIIEDSRATWKVDVVARLAGKGYRVVTRTRHNNFVLRRER